MTRPLKKRRAASNHISSVMLGSPPGTKCEHWRLHTGRFGDASGLRPPCDSRADASATSSHWVREPRCGRCQAATSLRARARRRRRQLDEDVGLRGVAGNDNRPIGSVERYAKAGATVGARRSTATWISPASRDRRWDLVRVNERCQRGASFVLDAHVDVPPAFICRNDRSSSRAEAVPTYLHLGAEPRLPRQSRKRLP